MSKYFTVSGREVQNFRSNNEWMDRQTYDRLESDHFLEISKAPCFDILLSTGNAPPMQECPLPIMVGGFVDWALWPIQSKCLTAQFDGPACKKMGLYPHEGPLPSSSNACPKKGTQQSFSFSPGPKPEPKIYRTPDRMLYSGVTNNGAGHR